VSTIVSVCDMEGTRNRRKGSIPRGRREMIPTTQVRGVERFTLPGKEEYSYVMESIRCHQRGRRLGRRPLGTS